MRIFSTTAHFSVFLWVLQVMVGLSLFTMAALRLWETFPNRIPTNSWNWTKTSLMMNWNMKARGKKRRWEKQEQDENWGSRKKCCWKICQSWRDRAALWDRLKRIKSWKQNEKCLKHIQNLLRGYECCFGKEKHFFLWSANKQSATSFTDNQLYCFAFNQEVSTHSNAPWNS